MAKQLGIHQIRGKVGERSYYRTKGVEAGISRSINQGMSARVKNGEEYANTRLNNAEFKNANAIASAAFNSVNTRKRGMMRNFAMASMTKAALEDIKQGSGAWGVRLPQTELDTLICSLLENHAKGGVYDTQFGSVTSATISAAGIVTISIDVEVDVMQNLASLGIDGFYVVPSFCLAGEIIVDDLPRLFAGHSIMIPQDQSVDTSEASDITISGSIAVPSNVGLSPSGYAFAQEDPNHGFYACITFLPYRTQGANRYTLQEYCTYVAIPLGQIPE